MSAHVMVDIDVHEPAGMREYLERVAGTLQGVWRPLHCPRGQIRDRRKGTGSQRGGAVMEFPNALA